MDKVGTNGDITVSGKPRKRSAVACNLCRTRRIKVSPYSRAALSVLVEALDPLVCLGDFCVYAFPIWRPDPNLSSAIAIVPHAERVWRLP